MDYFSLRLKHKSNILESSIFSIIVNHNTHLIYIIPRYIINHTKLPIIQWKNNFRVSVLYLLKWAVQYGIENSRNCPRLKFKQCFKEFILLLYGLLIFNWKRILHILNVDVTTQISTTFNKEKRRKN